MDKKKHYVEVNKIIKVMKNWAYRNGMLWHERHAKSLAEAIVGNAVVLTDEEYERWQGQTLNIKKVRKEAIQKFSKMLTKDRQTLDIANFETGKVCDKAYIIPQSFIDKICMELMEGM